MVPYRNIITYPYVFVFQMEPLRILQTRNRREVGLKWFESGELSAHGLFWLGIAISYLFDLFLPSSFPLQEPEAPSHFLPISIPLHILTNYHVVERN